MKTRRVGPGRYVVSEGGLRVQVLKNPDLRGSDKWLAYAEWDRFTYTDPGPTKAWAVGQAQGMIQDKVAEKGGRS